MWRFGRRRIEGVWGSSMAIAGCDGVGLREFGDGGLAGFGFEEGADGGLA